MPASFISSDAFREIFQSMSEGIVMVNEEGIIITANPVAEEMFMYAKNGLNGLKLEELLPERYRGRHVSFRKSFNAHPEPRRMGIGRDLTALRSDNTEFPVEISLSFTTVREQVLVMSFISDISLRKKAEEGLKYSEEQLIVYAAELEKKVETRTVALNETIKELEREINERKKAEEETKRALEKERELNDLKSKFVSIASHEFRTPLSTILSSISLVDQYIVRNELNKVDKHSHRIRASVNHLTGILNDFLSLGKLEEGKVVVDHEETDMTGLLHDIIEQMKDSLKEGQYIRINKIGLENRIVSDPRILRNILFNLISNASKYSDQGQEIEISYFIESDRMELRISDEGIGIPVGDHRHLFDRFFRASNVSNIQGTGLGLNIVKRYVSLLGGTIDFDRTRKRGSVFIVSIPLNYPT